MGIVADLELDVTRLASVAEAADARVREVEAKQAALVTEQASRALALAQRVDQGEAQLTASPARSIGDTLRKFFKTNHLEFSEMDDSLLVALADRLAERRAALATEAVAAGVAAEGARRELSKAQECAVLAAISVRLDELVPLVTHAEELRRHNSGLWPIGYLPAPVSPANSDHAFRAVLGEALSSGDAWQSRARATLQPFIEELRSGQEQEVAHV